MSKAYICDGIRTPIGRYGGALASVRTDDLATIPITELINRNLSVDWAKLDEVVLGCANQAGEDNRNVARMAVLLSGLPVSVAGITVNRLCASGMDAVGQAARAIECGAADLMIAGGVESMSRSPFVMAKATAAYDRNAEIYDSTIGWRFVNKKIASQYGIDSMPETAENLAAERGISREDQDAYAFRSQQRTEAARALLAEEIVPVTLPSKRGEPQVVAQDEHPRETTLEDLARLKAPFRDGGSITAGNASGVNDGACALLIASEAAVKSYGLKPIAKIMGMASAGVPPRIMGIGPVPASQKLLSRLGHSLADMDLIEINEAFAAQVLAVTRELGLKDDDPRVNPNGGAIALGHPLGMSGARLVLSAALQLKRSGGRHALCTLCVGVGQGVSLMLEGV
ncbi:MAG: 3-oxoadipyl-CoA thiolase [Armatimonadetes bacterium]|nr:3-oxoadipyl-CoA thiolase [Armatimonadota bacterium]